MCRARFYLAMSVDAAVAKATADNPELVVASASSVPKAWGALAARGVSAFKELTGRAPTDAERRAIWSGLWREVTRVRAAEDVDR